MPATASAAESASSVTIGYSATPALVVRGRAGEAVVRPVDRGAKRRRSSEDGVGGYSTDPLGSPGAYKVYGPGTVSVERSEHGSGGLDAKVDETWVAKGQDGNELDLHVSFVRGVPALSSFDVHNYSAADPAFYRIYRGEQVVDVLRSVNTGVNRVQTIELKASGSGKLAKAINGSEKIIAINALPFYRRLTFLRDPPERAVVFSAR